MFGPPLKIIFRFSYFTLDYRFFWNTLYLVLKGDIEMKCNDKYVQRVIGKYNRGHVTSFGEKRAEQCFLAPLGLTLKYTPPADFGNNCERLPRQDEFNLFAALHYIKYKITRTKASKCRERYLQIYLALRNRGISANCPLIFNCVKRHAERFNRDIVDNAQLIERGHMSLINSVDGFDPWLGYRFSTYACNSITRSFFNRAQVVRPTVSIDELDDVGEKPVDESHELWLERVNLLLQSDILSFKEKEVLNYRFHEKLTLKEVGVIWGLTKERVRQIQVDALSKLKEGLNKDPILA